MASGAEEGTFTMRWATWVHYEASRQLMNCNPDFRRLSVEAQAILSYIAWRTLCGKSAGAKEVREVFPWVPESTIRLGVQKFIDAGLLMACKDPRDGRKLVYTATQWGKELYQVPCDELFEGGMAYAGELKASAYATELMRGGSL